jgi:hypothetical protein
MNCISKGRFRSLFTTRCSGAIRSARLLTGLCLLLGLTSISGCGLVEWMRGPGLDGPNSSLGDGLRGSNSNGPWGTGVDERARQIERNLGYRN